MIFSYSNTWNFKSTGMTFPGNAVTSGTVGRDAVVSFKFSSASAIQVDYGDGNVVLYNAVSDWVMLRNYYDPNTGTNTATYTYSTGNNSSQRIVKVKILEPAKLVEVNLSYVLDLVPQIIPLKFSSVRNLRGIYLAGTKAMGIDESYLQLPEIVTLSIADGFDVNSRYYGVIPIDVLTGKKYRTFVYSRNNLGNKTFEVSNLDKIAPLLKNTLLSLGLGNNMLTDANGGLPANFSELTQLQSLDLTQNINYTIIPPVVNTLTSLATLTLTNCIGLTVLSNIDNLVNLVTLSMNNTGKIAPGFPSGFGNLTRLKTIYFQGCGRNEGLMDEWISEFYAFYTAHAALTGDNFLPFRGVKVDVGKIGPTDTLTQIPSGAYQAPAGFVLGVANGSPTSSLEKIYVLVNQYGHSWTYRTV